MCPSRNFKILFSSAKISAIISDHFTFLEPSTQKLWHTSCLVLWSRPWSSDLKTGLPTLGNTSVNCWLSTAIHSRVGIDRETNGVQSLMQTKLKKITSVYVASTHKNITYTTLKITNWRFRKIVVMVLHLSPHNYQRPTTLAVVVELMQKNSLCAHFKKFLQLTYHSNRSVNQLVSDKIIHIKRSRGKCYWPFVTLANGVTGVGLVLRVISIDGVVGQNAW